MNYNITELEARSLLENDAVGVWPSPRLYALYHRIGEVFPHLKEEYSYLDWDKFSQSS